MRDLLFWFAVFLCVVGAVAFFVGKMWQLFSDLAASYGLPESNKGAYLLFAGIAAVALGLLLFWLMG